MNGMSMNYELIIIAIFALKAFYNGFSALATK